VPHENAAPEALAREERVNWTSASTSGTGRFTLADPHAAIFTGFATGAFPIPLGDIQIQKLETPFASIMVIPADPTKTLADAGHLLLSATARVENPNQKWNDKRTTLSTNWGQSPRLHRPPPRRRRKANQGIRHLQPNPHAWRLRHPLVRAHP
jgi:hypothetical protein